MHVVDAHAGQKDKRRAFSGEYFRNAKAIAFGTTEFDVEDGDVEPWFTLQQLECFGCARNANSLCRAGSFDNLLDIERDQKFIVEYKAALSG